MIDKWQEEKGETRECCGSYWSYAVPVTWTEHHNA